MNTNTIALFAAVMTASVAVAEMDYATPESQGVKSEAIMKWLDACEATFTGTKEAEGRDSMHGFSLVKNGKVIAEGSWKPYDTLRKPHKLYSHTKSFTSTAIGLLVDDGKLDLDERIVDIFSDKLPKDVSENLKQLRVRDLLTMNVGAKYTDAERKDIGGDWEKAFMANTIEHKPGTEFRYDSCASHMLAAIVQRRSEMRMTEFLEGRLFAPLHFDEVLCTQSPTGVDCGGWGMSITTRDMASFGQLLLQNGEWEGKRLLSSEWIQMATGRQTWSGKITVEAQVIGSGSDWDQGYGFQFWRCRNNAYRADGAFGQVTLVMPKQNAVLSMNSGLGPMQKEVDLVWEHLFPALTNNVALPENDEMRTRLEKRCKTLSIAPLKGTKDGFEKFNGLKFAFDANHRGLGSVEFSATDDGWTVKLRTRAGENTFKAGLGKWEKGVVKVDPEGYEGLGTIFGEQKVVTSAGMRNDGSFRCKLLFVEDTGWLNIVLMEKEGKKTLVGELWCMGGCTFSGKAN